MARHGTAENAVNRCCSEFSEAEVGKRAAHAPFMIAHSTSGWSWAAMPPRRHGDQSGLRARANRCAGYGRGGGLPTLHPLFASYGQAYPEVEAEIAAREKVDRPRCRGV